MRASTAPSSRRSPTCGATGPGWPTSCSTILHPGRLADTAGYAPDIPLASKLELLETSDVTERLRLAIAAQRERLADASLRQRIREDVAEGLDQTQREMLLRRQLAAIRKELGEGEGDGDDEWATRIAESGMPEAARVEAERELGRLERQPEGPEAGMIRTYLEWMVSLPWDTRSEEHLDVADAREVLDADHAGLDEVKERILEYLAVRTPAPRARHGRRPQRRDPDAGRAPRHRQDLARPLGRARPGARVRPHQPGRHPRRGRDPRPPPHLRRRASRAARPRPPARPGR